MTSPTEPTEPSATPIRDVLARLGIRPRPLPPDDEVYTSAWVFFPSAPKAQSGEADLPAS